MSSQPSGSRTRLEDTLKSPSPKPGHHLYLSKPLPGSTTANNSSISLNLNDAALSPAAPHTPSGGGLRAHLGHLLPRHTYFRVSESSEALPKIGLIRLFGSFRHARVTIHQISSVPFVGGEFGVRWKFKNVQIPAPGKGQKGEGKGQGQGQAEGRGAKGGRPGLFDRVKSKSRAGEKRAPIDKGKGREDALMSPGVLSPGAEEAHNVIDALGLTSPGVEEEFGHAPQKIAFTRSASGPAAVSTTMSTTSTDPSVVGMSRTQTTSSQTPSVSSHSSQTTHSSQHLSIDWGTTITTSAGTSTTNSSTTTVGLGLPPPSPSTTTTTTPSLSDPSSLSLPTPTPNNNNTTSTAYSPARGMTPFLPLKDHSVTWSYPLTTVLRIDVDRENAQLAPSPLKLVVMQRVVPDDPHGSPQNPRLGAVYLNLSEYVGQGAVERRYLLRESKTNATLKLTIELDYLSGEAHYVPPPLAKGEILTGIAGFLDKNKDIVKRRPRALDIYGPYRDQEELEVDLLGLGSGTGMGLFSGTTAGGLTARVGGPRTGGLRTARSERGFALSDEHSQNLEDDAHEASDTENDDHSHSHNNYDSEAPSADEHSLSHEPDEPTLPLPMPHPHQHRAPFDVQKLPFAYGTKTTEALIDALFNPVVIHEKREESPFTIYRPPSTRSGSKARDGVGRHDGLGRSKSTRSTGSSSTGQSQSYNQQQQNQMGMGLGLSGVPPLMDRNGTITATAKPTKTKTGTGTRASSRQGSLASSINHEIGIDSSAVSTYSSNASIRTTTSTSESSSANNNNINLNDSPSSRSRSGDASVPRSTPEGRIVVDPTLAGANEEMQMQVGGLRGWWRRHTGVQRA